MIRPKSQNFKIGHDGILSIGNFILMIKNHILLFRLPGNCPTTKKCAPYFRGNMEFPIYFNSELVFLFLDPKLPNKSATKFIHGEICWTKLSFPHSESEYVWEVP
jgi:hypothetical protein